MKIKRIKSEAEVLNEIYETNYPPHDINIEAYKKQIEEHNEKFRNIGVDLPKQSKSTSTPLEVQIANINNRKDRKGMYPPE